ncbi:hypothetical protein YASMINEVIRUS_1273 [Yasminevirus sp. GU-2018]|uniref:Uncharacterized protein n=1 Tax=Yasminevirus sp. GU-2018 TaxID=2420051 RepID=A0A5K0UAU2_9VIRU|nr:hypothetical protein YASMINEVIRUS_1273 [Yasminevirus sp. GU-2018]
MPIIHIFLISIICRDIDKMGNCCASIAQTVEVSGTKISDNTYPFNIEYYKETLTSINPISLTVVGNTIPANTSGTVISFTNPIGTVTRNKSVFDVSVVDNPCGTDSVTLKGCNLYVYVKDNPICFIVTLKPDTDIKAEGTTINVSNATSTVVQQFDTTVGGISDVPGGVTNKVSVLGSIKTVVNATTYTVNFLN